MEQVQQIDADALAENYIILSEDLSYARTFYPESQVIRYLNYLINLYQVNIYGYQSQERKGLFSFWKTTFPALLYEHRRTLQFAFLFFFVAVFIGVFSTLKEETFVRLILGDAYVDRTLDNIARGTPMGVYNSSGEMDMFFSITLNNIKVSFVAFVFGVFLSAGSLWILFTNGIMVGAFQCFFFREGLLLHSALSVWAHGTFEITSIVLAGGAGLVMGNSFLFPGTYSRRESFKTGALKGIKIIVGLLPFFVIAGFIESFVTRYADYYPLVGACVVLLSLGGVISYFVLYPYYLHKPITDGKTKPKPTA